MESNKNHHRDKTIRNNTIRKKHVITIRDKPLVESTIENNYQVITHPSEIKLEKI